MIIEGVIPGYQPDRPQGFFVRMSAEEMEAICGKDPHGDYRKRAFGVGDKIAVCDRMKRVNDVEREAGKARSAIDNLRALANLLELQLPAVTAVVEATPAE